MRSTTPDPTPRIKIMTATLNGTDAEKDGELVVAYLGPEGSYTHQAALQHFPPSSSSSIPPSNLSSPHLSTSSPTTLEPYPTIASVFTAVSSGAAAFGVVPYENSSNGSVVSTLDLLRGAGVRGGIGKGVDDAGGEIDEGTVIEEEQGEKQDEGEENGIIVCGEQYVAVHHCLIGYPHPTASPDTTTTTTTTTPLPSLSHIRHLYSHPQAWTQITHFLRTALPHATRHDTPSTSAAAHLAAQDRSGASAAIASQRAAAEAGVSVLVRGVNDRPDNRTRFLVLRQAGRGVMGGTTETVEAGPTTRDDVVKVLLCITPGAPGAPAASIAQLLRPFAVRALDVTNVTSRPRAVPYSSCISAAPSSSITESPQATTSTTWARTFFLEFQHASSASEVEDAVAAMRELGGVCAGLGARWRVLGRWAGGEGGVVEV